MDNLEAQLIKKCKQYDIKAQKELYLRYSPRLFTIAKRYLIDSDDAKDVLQDSFLSIFTSIGKFRGDGSLEGWMKRIVINTSLQFLKHRKQMSQYVNIDEYEPECEPDYNQDNHFDKSDIRNRTMGIELVREADLQEKELMAVIQTLPEDFRKVFNLYFIDNFSHSEIAGMLEIDEVTSRTRLARAKKKVQAELYKQCLERLTV